MTASASQATLTTSYLGLKLAHPFILGASPLTGDLDNVRRLEDGGCAAICMHSLFEEQIAEVVSGGFPHLDHALPRTTGDGTKFHVPEKFPLRPDEYVEQIRKIKAAVSIPVIASLNGVGVDGWLTYATLLEQAGADALEVNLYYLSTGGDDSSSQIEKHIEALVRKLKAQIRIPLAVKLTPFYTAFAGLARRLEAAGAWSLDRAIARSADLLKRRGVVVVISDFYDATDATFRELRRVARRGHDVAMLQVLSRPEIDFPFAAHLEFEDLESGERRVLDARAVGGEYRTAVAEFLTRCRRQAHADGIDYALMPTDVAPERALRTYLLRREAAASAAQSAVREHR